MDHSIMKYAFATTCVHCCGKHFVPIQFHNTHTSFLPIHHITSPSSLAPPSHHHPTTLTPLPHPLLTLPTHPPLTPPSHHLPTIPHTTLPSPPHPSLTPPPQHPSHHTHLDLSWALHLHYCLSTWKRQQRRVFWALGEGKAHSSMTRAVDGHKWPSTLIHIQRGVGCISKYTNKYMCTHTIHI